MDMKTYTNKQNVIFGAGFYGAQALERIGAEHVACFLDNDERKIGTSYCGKPVVGFSQLTERRDNIHVIISGNYVLSMKRDLEQHGFFDYEILQDGIRGYYETERLVLNTYEVMREAKNEQEWNRSNRLAYARKEVFEAVEALYGETRLFEHIELETINRCNGVCSFCPVNRNSDPREHKTMTWELYESIVAQLEELSFGGRFTTFSNNEPLLDERIIAWNRYAREHLPHARIHLFTNGTLLTLDKFIALAEVLDELIIDNYNQDLRLIPTCQRIAEYCELHPELKKKVTIVLRKPNEILTSRGGSAPNRMDIPDYAKDRCILPFKQMIVRPDGKVSLCCNDALGAYTLGDLTKERLVDVWYGNAFQTVRRSLYEGRENWGNCRHCDTFSLY